MAEILNNKSLVSSANYLTDLDSTYSKHVTINKNNIHIPNGITHSVELIISIFNKHNLTDDVVVFNNTVNSNASIVSYLNSISSNIISFISDATVSSVASINSNQIGDVSYSLDCLSTDTVIKNINIKVSYGNIVKYDIKSVSNDYIKLFTNAGLLTKEELNRISMSIENIDSIVNVSENIDDVNNVSANILSINNVDLNILDIKNVSTNIDSVNTVDSNIDDVIAVSDNIANVNTVGNNINNVTISSSNISDINNVSNNINSVNTVSTNINSVNNVSSISDDVVIASGISDDISAVALIDDSIVVVSNNIDNVNTVSSNIDNVNIVGTDIVNVNKVANVDDEIVVISPYVLDIETVSDNIANVNASGANINSINIVSSNIDSIITDANNIGDIVVVANDLSLAGFENIVDAGSILEDVSVEASGISLIKTVADNIDEVFAAGSNIAAIIGVNANETNINSIVSDVIPNMAEILLSDNNAAIATTKALEASASEALAHKWADNPENVPVTGTIGVDEEYSAYHWAKKAEAAIGGNITFDSLYDVDTTGILDGGTVVWNQSLGQWVDYDFAHNDKLAFDLTAGVTVATGEIAWNADEGTADLGLPGGSTLQIGQENVRTVRNATASTISNGRLCMFDGTIGNSGRIKVKPFTAGFNEAMYLYGVATQNIISGSDGIITIEGKVRGINTTGAVFGEVWSDEDILYAKPNDNGAMTNVEPEDNQLKLVVATVIHAHATNGCLEIRFMPFNENMYYTKAQNDILLNSKVPLSGDFTLDLGGL